VKQVFFSEMLSAFEDYLNNYIERHTNEILAPVVLYVVRNGGKRIRPLYTLLTAQLLGHDWTIALDYAVIVELFHNATLFHDDIMDQDAVRRGKEAVYIKHGVIESILSGDLLFGLTGYLAANKSRRFLKSLAKTIINTVSGQALQLRNRRKIVDAETCIKIAYLKTGSLFETALIGGGVAVNADESTLDRLARMGQFIGTAYQLQDDIIGIFSEPEKSGKLVGIDLANGDPTLFVAYTANAEIPPEDKDYILGIYQGKIKPFDLERVRTIFKEYGILRKVQNEIRRRVNAVKDLLSIYSHENTNLFIKLTEIVFSKAFNF